MKKLLLLAICAFTFAACSSEETPTTDPTPETTTDTTTTAEVDTVAPAMVDTTQADTMDTLGSMGMMTEEEMAAAEAEEEEKTANAWDFCQCVREQKRIEDALMEEEDDAKFDALMAEMDAIGENCPDLANPGNQTSMDAKKAYERRVKKCLKGS